MRIKTKILSLFFPFLLIQQSFSQQPSELKRPLATLININKISAWVHADGRIGFNPYTKDWGVSYPRGTAGVVWQDGIVWGGFVRDGQQPELRTGGGMWSVGTVPGAILTRGVAEDTTSSDVRVWRIRRDWQTANLISDAAEFFYVSMDSVTQDQIDAIRFQYEKDWNEWPWKKGAPFYDTNDNGVMDIGEEPGLAFADQVVWFVANDLDSTKYKSPVTGLETQVTLWAYNRTGSQLNDALQHIVFKQVKLIYKGGFGTPQNARIDSMFVSQFADTEIGYCCDDFAGCDTTLQLGYGYNSSSADKDFQKFNLSPPAFGYAALQRALTPEGNSSNKQIFNFDHKDYTNLKMSSFWLHASGGSNSPPSQLGGYQSVIRMYNLLNGFLPYSSLSAFINPNGEKTKFVLPGDPVTGAGWIDGLSGSENYYPGYGAYGLPMPSVRYFSMNFGPYTLAFGDTLEVVLAMVGGLGEDRLASVTVMKFHTQFARQMRDYSFDIGFRPVPVVENSQSAPQDFRLYQNHPNPFRRNTTIRYNLPAQRNVKLSIYNILGQEIKTLVNNIQNPGNYSYEWDGKDLHRQPVPNGIYIYKIETGSVILTKKLVVME